MLLSTIFIRMAKKLLWIFLSLSGTYNCFSNNYTDSLQYYLQSQDYAQAILWLRSNPPADYNNAYLLNLGYCYYMNDEHKKALPCYQAVYDRDPVNLQANLYLGIIYKNLKQFYKALTFYKNLTVIKPGEYKYWLYAGSMYSYLDMEDSSFAFTEKAYQIRPQAADAALSYSRALLVIKNKKAAVSVIDGFLEKDSNNVDVIERKINYSAKDAKHTEVIFWGERLWSDLVIAPVAYTDLAYAYLNTGQIERSLAIYQRMELENQVSEALKYCAALCYAQKADYIKSNLLLSECLAQNLLPEAKTYFRARADNYENIKEFKKAIAQYDTSYYLFRSPYDLYYKARVYDAYLNNKQQASVFYKKFIAAKQKPEGAVEEKIFNYISEYIKP